MMPRFGLMNRGYETPPFTDPSVRAEFKTAMQTVFNILQLNIPGSHAAGGDDMLVWFRNLGFMSDPDFVRAFEPYADDKVMLARMWRIYTLCWAAKSCMSVFGSFVDLGCYDGRTVDVMRRYCPTWIRPWWLFDAFDRHPAGDAKQHHGPRLEAQVRKLFSDNPHIKVIPGLLPSTLQSDMPEAIAFMQVDLNSAITEIECLALLYDRVSPGGIIVLDDYGQSAYRDSYEAEKAFFAERGQSVYECPTGQGIMVKR